MAMKKQWNINEHVWQCLFLTVLVHCYWKPTFSKLHSEKLCSVSVGWVRTDGYSEKKTPGVSRNKDASQRSHKSVKTILFAVFVLNKCCNALGIFLKLSGQQRISYVMDSWTEGIILEGIKLIQTIIVAYRNTMDFNKSVVTGYVAL